MKDLQALIDERAEKKLNYELEKVRKILHGEGGFISMVDNLEKVMVSLGNKTDSFRSAFWSPTSFGFEQMKIKLLPIYKENETALFLKEIEDLKQRTTELQNEVSNLNY